MKMMNSRSLKRQLMARSTSYKENFVKKVRKPYTITKSRENWSDEEHDKFLEALHLFGRDWKKIEDYVGSKSVIQIRSHAQKYFLKIQKNGAVVHVPPPRPKRRAVHPYPQKPIKTASLVHPSGLSCAAPGIIQWNDSALLVNTASNGSMSSQDDLIYLPSLEADIASESPVSLSDRSFSGGSSSILWDMPQQGSLGMPDFGEVYNFIGSVFDLDTKSHLQKLKKMDQVNMETVLILMKNLTIKLSSPQFEPIGKVQPSYGPNDKIGGMAEVIAKNHNSYYLQSLMAGN